MSASQKFMGVVKGLILSYLLTIIMREDLADFTMRRE